jgi:hypothetical protein
MPQVIFEGLGLDGAAKAAVRALESLDTLKRADERRSAYAHFHRPSHLAEFVCGVAVRLPSCFGSHARSTTIYRVRRALRPAPDRAFEKNASWN